MINNMIKNNIRFLLRVIYNFYKKRYIHFLNRKDFNIMAIQKYKIYPKGQEYKALNDNRKRTRDLFKKYYIYTIPAAALDDFIEETADKIIDLVEKEL